MKHCKVGGGHKELLTVDANRSVPQTILRVLQVAMLDFHGGMLAFASAGGPGHVQARPGLFGHPEQMSGGCFHAPGEITVCALLHEQRFILSGARLKETLRQCLDERRTFFVLLHKYGIQALLEEGRFAAVAVCDEHAEDSWTHLVLGFLRVK